MKYIFLTYNATCPKRFDQDCSQRASSPFGSIVKSRRARDTREEDANAGEGGWAGPRGFAPRSRVLAGLAQIGEVARRLGHLE